MTKIGLPKTTFRPVVNLATIVFFVVCTMLACTTKPTDKLKKLSKTRQTLRNPESIGILWMGIYLAKV
jgi:hypothetical protein